MKSTFHSKSRLYQSNPNAYMKNRWYAVALSKDVKPYPINQYTKPYGTRILGRDVIVFRDEKGIPQCLDGICPHRGAPLNIGKVIENNITCPYHGWNFDGNSGKLCKVPSCSSQIPKCMIPKYPLIEKGGFIWLFFGDKSPLRVPPVPFVPELEDSKWKAVYGSYTFNAPHSVVFDNAIDMTHIHYLHGNSFGNENNPFIKFDDKIDENDDMFTTYFKIKNKPANIFFEWTKTDYVDVKATVFLPSTSSIQIFLGGNVSMITFVNTTPIDDKRSVNYYALIRNFSPWSGFDNWAENAMHKIFKEDQAMVELLKPEKSSSPEISLSSVDKPQLILRKKRINADIYDNVFVDPSETDRFMGKLFVE